MAIVKMSRFSLLHFDAQREILLKKLQSFGYVHFVDLREEEDPADLDFVDMQKELTRTEADIVHLNWMMELLKDYDPRPTGLQQLKTGPLRLSLEELEERFQSVDYKKDYYELREIKDKIDALEHSVHDLEEKQRSFLPWRSLPFIPSESQSLNQAKLITGVIARKFFPGLQEVFRDFPLSYFQLVSEEAGNIYLFILSHQQESEELADQIRKAGFLPLKLESEQTIEESYQLAENKIKELRLEQEVWRKKLPGYATRIEDYEVVYEYLNNQRMKYSVTGNFKKTDRMNWIEGYLPTTRVEEFRKLLQEELGEDFYLKVQAADVDDPSVPVLLDNNKFVDSFSSVTGMYAMPKYNEIDPTPFFAPFYLMFFGMMGADVGYGLIILTATAVALKFFNLKDSMRTFIRFFFFLSFSVIGWGLVYGSFFGDLVPLPHLIDTNKDFMLLLILSIAFGLVHLFFALGLKAYMLFRDGKPMDAIYDVFSWYLALGGAILWLISSMVEGLPPVLADVGQWTMIAGMVLIVAFAARDSKSFVGRIVGGLYSLYGISGYVGDFVSYSRLMALGLAGGFIGVAVNMIVKMLFGAGILGLVGGIVVFGIFHLFNVFLSMLGAYVHTSRLTYVEFFGKFYEGGGRTFQKFRSEPKYINLKEK